MDIYGDIKTFLKKQKALTETKKSSKFLSFLPICNIPICMNENYEKKNNKIKIQKHRKGIPDN